MTNTYEYEVVFHDMGMCSVGAANFTVSRSDVTFYDENEEINYWFPLDALRYIRKRP